MRRASIHIRRFGCASTHKQSQKQQGLTVAIDGALAGPDQRGQRAVFLRARPLLARVQLPALLSSAKKNKLRAKAGASPQEKLIIGTCRVEIVPECESATRHWAALGPEVNLACVCGVRACVRACVCA